MKNRFMSFNGADTSLTDLNYPDPVMGVWQVLFPGDLVATIIGKRMIKQTRSGFTLLP